MITMIQPTGKAKTAKCYRCKTIYYYDSEEPLKSYFKMVVEPDYPNSSGKYECMVCNLTIEFHTAFQS
jgi:hypothetical protein